MSWNDPRVTAINPDATYDAEHPTSDNAWAVDTNRSGQCGEMVQIEMVSAIEEGRAFQTRGPVVTIDNPGGGGQTRWVPRA
ncbi:hypothetical protein [Streptomyces sp. NPDC093591]|uniref:hypothetical protein n=1 Tax=Streptomyces sp. NPDC093591 TaxID=3366044 RepID=UPI0038030DB4